MSGTSLRLTWGVVVADGYQWTQAERDEAEACTECDGDWLDHPTHLLRAAMAEAGDAVIAAHPDMFRTELV